ncbi:thioredoxin family protein [Ferdinandcohnia quinoae]|uniref:Thioredoxin family protein n=1 Tax=Fredinandcohnia quinoae TaxID=2918902 RepID=A0AAW5E1Y4_9BACI|nr:thioredoxin family protein [Fredinandcohnia sp. SECRCQ15]MCH1625574.1 thioredoxin family protein [Fredinandcohnia sp. SECRCQ15]
MNEWNEKDIDEAIAKKDFFCLYLYTPLCGTCQVASKMMQVVTEIIPDVAIGKCDLNYIPGRAFEWEVESVPCLLIFQNSKVYNKIYAFKNVPYLLEIISNK